MLDKPEYHVNAPPCISMSFLLPACLIPPISFPLFLLYSAQGIVCPFDYMDALFILQFPILLRKQMLLKPASSESSFQPAPGSVIIAQGQLGTG